MVNLEVDEQACFLIPSFKSHAQWSIRCDIEKAGQFIFDKGRVLFERIMNSSPHGASSYSQAAYGNNNALLLS